MTAEPPNECLCDPLKGIKWIRKCPVHGIPEKPSHLTSDTSLVEKLEAEIHSNPYYMMGLKRAIAIVRQHQAAPCPFIISSDEGTSYCRLAAENGPPPKERQTMSSFCIRCEQDMFNAEYKFNASHSDPSEISVVDDARSDFEQWAQSKKLPTVISEHFITAGAYANQDTHVAWLAWKARGEIKPVSVELSMEQTVAKHIREKGFTGLCSAHQNGENSKCLICYPEREGDK